MEDQVSMLIQVLTLGTYCLANGKFLHIVPSYLHCTMVDCLQKTVHTYSSAIFISLARARVNDEAEKCRKLAALGIKTLLSRVERNIRTKLFNMAFKWLQEDKVGLLYSKLY